MCKERRSPVEDHEVDFISFQEIRELGDHFQTPLQVSILGNILGQEDGDIHIAQRGSLAGGGGAEEIKGLDTLFPSVAAKLSLKIPKVHGRSSMATLRTRRHGAGLLEAVSYTHLTLPTN